MTIKTITTKELRTNFPTIKRAVDHGEAFVVIYRSKPFAQLLPITTEVRRTDVINVSTLPAFGIWQNRIQKAGGASAFLTKLRHRAWQV